jgi:hypothetical protein
MPLTKEDLDKIGELFETKVKDMQASFQSTIDDMGKRLRRLEAGFADMSRVAQVTVTDNARKDHDRLLRSMFDESTLVAVPPLVEDQHGVFSRPIGKCSQQELANKITNIMGTSVKFEIEPTKVGFRLMMASVSPQARRKMAALIIKDARKEVQDDLGLYLQYDKPHPLRIMQKTAYKFLSVLKKRGADAIRKTELKGGYLVINGVRFAPEYLVPGQGYWNSLADQIIEKVRSWRGKAPISPEGGAMTDTFG